MAQSVLGSPEAIQEAIQGADELILWPTLSDLAQWMVHAGRRGRIRRLRCFLLLYWFPSKDSVWRLCWYHSGHLQPCYLEDPTIVGLGTLKPTSADQHVDIGDFSSQGSLPGRRTLSMTKSRLSLAIALRQLLRIVTARGSSLFMDNTLNGVAINATWERLEEVSSNKFTTVCHSMSLDIAVCPFNHMRKVEEYATYVWIGLKDRDDE